MEDHNHQYGMGDLRQLMNGRSSGGGNFYTAISQPHSTVELMNSDQLAAAQAQHLEMLQQFTSSTTDHQLINMPPRSPFLHHPHHQLFRSDSTATAATSSGNNMSMGANSAAGNLDMDLQCGGGDTATGRWPRQETLTLLEIRSRLDPKFKEANQKGPLWDDVSRIMSEDHGYQRSGKKCREKFENLYKYYKKTKEGKAGRQDGKHYRFFRQLEALYGDSSGTNIPTTSETPHLAGVGANTFPYNSQPPSQEMFHQAPRQIIDDSFTPSNSSAFVTSSSDEYCSDLNAAMALKRRAGKRSWKAKIKDFIDGQMRKLMEKQEGWLEKMMKSIEQKEKERMMREEEWRKQEAARIDREQKFWAKERAWIEARDAGLIEALHKLTGINKELRPVNSSSPEADQELADHHQLPNENANGSDQSLMTNRSESWPEHEVTRLIQLRTSMDTMFVQQSGTSEEEALWEEIASNMACLGYENRSALTCKHKWESINNYLTKTKDQCCKKRRENNTSSLSSSCFYFQNNESICNNQGLGGGGEYGGSNDLGAGGGLELSTTLLTQSGHHMNASRPAQDSSIAGGTMQGSSFRFFMGDQAADNLWENYGLKLSKGDNNN